LHAGVTGTVRRKSDRDDRLAMAGVSPRDCLHIDTAGWSQRRNTGVQLTILDNTNSALPLGGYGDTHVAAAGRVLVQVQPAIVVARNQQILLVGPGRVQGQDSVCVGVGESRRQPAEGELNAMHNCTTTAANTAHTHLPTASTSVAPSATTFHNPCTSQPAEGNKSKGGWLGPCTQCGCRWRSRRVRSWRSGHGEPHVDLPRLELCVAQAVLLMSCMSAG